MIKSESKEAENAELFEKLSNFGHQSHLLAFFAQENSSRDCIIRSKDGYFLCHKLILAASNSFFRQILQPFQVEEVVYILMVDFETREIQELISSAYKHSLENSDLKKLFFSECKPFQLEEQNAEQVRIKEDIIQSIKFQKDSLKETKALTVEVQPFIVKQESPDHDMFFDTDFPIDEDIRESNWIPKAENKKKKTKLKNKKIKKTKKKLKVTKKIPKSEDLLDDPEWKENTKPFKLVKERKKHKNPKVPSSAYPIPCVNCGKELKNSVTRCKHMKKCGVTSAKKGPKICERCGASFAFSSDLKKHLSINCENACKICGQVFPTRYAQRDHLFYVHGQVSVPITKKEVEEKFSCDQCDKVYHQKPSLINHVKKAHQKTKDEMSENKPAPAPPSFQCNECGKTLGSVQILANHMSLHKPPELPCPICGKLFHNKKYVDRHAKSAHVQQQDMRFNCDLCGKGFTDKKKLEQHTNVHLNLKPYKCRWCDRAYQNVANQNAHERTIHREEYLLVRSAASTKRIQVQKREPSPMDSE
eukprot:TRINITY_DN11973_c0_g1_i1.p1 TRINITY_DN11973_c0_g1~~TRINITY_DN11973_c0_g1_i1.p1  ORF type:complete len:532 (-),score=107.87 TRINITY_DN11973_c0_g1_i1:32-1627(-)